MRPRAQPRRQVDGGCRSDMGRSARSSRAARRTTGRAAPVAAPWPRDSACTDRRRRRAAALIRALQPHDFSLPLSAVPALTEQQLADDLTRAMKAREMPRVYVLRGLITAAKNLKIERRGAALAEVDLVQLVRREIR